MKAILISIVFCLVCFFTGYWFRGKEIVERTKERVIKEVRTDTLTKYYPYPYLMTWRDTIRIKDTILVQQVKEYKDSSYYVRISGYNPILEQIEVYSRTEYITKETIKTIKEKNNRWGIGITAGYGLSKDGLSPGIMLGITYRIK